MKCSRCVKLVQHRRKMAGYHQIESQLVFGLLSSTLKLTIKLKVEFVLCVVYFMFNYM